MRRVLGHLQGPYALVGQVLYGSGLRLKEGLRLRIKDVDFDQSCIVVRDAKGHKDRITVLPESLKVPLKTHTETCGRCTSKISPKDGGV